MKITIEIKDEEVVETLIQNIGIIYRRIPQRGFCSEGKLVNSQNMEVGSFTIKN